MILKGSERGFTSDALPGAFSEAEAIAEIERKLGLENQPLAILFHEKGGRRHAHFVWSRIDGSSPVRQAF